eukprot:1683158-Rhodomonas_salina.1
MSGGVGSEETSSGSQNVMSEEERLKKRAARFGVANETPPKQQDEAMEGTKDGPAPVGTDAKSEKKQDGGGGDDASGGADHDAATGKKRSRLSGRLGVITDEVQQEKKPREEMDLDKLLESEEAKLMQELGVTARSACACKKRCPILARSVCSVPKFGTNAESDAPRTQTQLEHKVVSRLEQAAEQRVETPDAMSGPETAYTDLSKAFGIPCPGLTSHAAMPGEGGARRTGKLCAAKSIAANHNPSTNCPTHADNSAAAAAARSTQQQRQQQSHQQQHAAPCSSVQHTAAAAATRSVARRRKIMTAERSEESRRSEVNGETGRDRDGARGGGKLADTDTDTVTGIGTDTDTQTHRHTDTDTDTDTETQRHRDTDTDAARHKDPERQKDTEAHQDRHTETHRHTHRHTDTDMRVPGADLRSV